MTLRLQIDAKSFAMITILDFKIEHFKPLKVMYPAISIDSQKSPYMS